METLPKKILRIKDFTYILPDDFSGSFDDAVSEFLKYSRNKNKHDTLSGEMNNYSSVNVLLSSDNEAKACGAYGIFELDESSGDYKLMETAN